MIERDSAVIGNPILRRVTVTSNRSPGIEEQMTTWHRMLAAAIAAGMTAAPHPVGAQRGGAPTAPTGVWEPVSYGEDVALNSVYFVTPDEGWVAGGGAGGHGIILHTTDAGQHWDVALGDPAGTQPAFTDLRFIDRRTGFAVQATHAGDYSLLRTTDGAHWEVSGTVPQHQLDYYFVSPTVGVASIHNEIRRTTDAGRTWSKVFDCALKVSINGLARTVRCEAAAFAFPTATLGYALGNSYDARGMYLMKTEDGGATWTAWLAVPDVDGREGHLFFNDERTGYICTADGRLYGTTDGAQTWNGLAGAQCEVKAAVRFADHDVGWTLRYHKLTWTADGGQRWASRDVAFPAPVAAFSLPRRDLAYAVGDHGMIFRYRVVIAGAPLAAGALPAPAMPPIPATLTGDISQLQTQVAAVDSAVSAAPSSAAPGMNPPAATGGGFAQDAVSPFVTNCCARRMSTIQTVFNAITAVVPDFTSRYRNLNLLTQGLRTAAQLPDAATSIRAALQTFRASGDRNAALAALSQLKSLLATLRAAGDTAVQQPTFVQNAP